MERFPREYFVPWTKMDKVSEYEKLADAALVVADGKPLAEWELIVYPDLLQRRQASSVQSDDAGR